MRKPRNDDRAIIEMLGDDQEFAVEFLHMMYGELDDEEEEELFLAALHGPHEPAGDAAQATETAPGRQCG
ncbi:hypothetical protein [Acerihabitans arboris]|uniref:Uncharacterized protein n=1 Tax=Acerihabitans arboris TaxID=2691583 RepID=A0A845SIV1_9GAMM|nr:hypothetical protein [Acerihabitans arboris]NDL63869.1 hypothetical protein [Acerihabitans arboris]